MRLLTFLVKWDACVWVLEASRVARTGPWHRGVQGWEWQWQWSLGIVAPSGVHEGKNKGIPNKQCKAHWASCFPLCICLVMLTLWAELSVPTLHWSPSSSFQWLPFFRPTLFFLVTLISVSQSTNFKLYCFSLPCICFLLMKFCFYICDVVASTSFCSICYSFSVSYGRSFLNWFWAFLLL